MEAVDFAYNALWWKWPVATLINLAFWYAAWRLTLGFLKAFVIAATYARQVQTGLEGDPRADIDAFASIWGRRPAPGRNAPHRGSWGWWSERINQWGNRIATVQVLLFNMISRTPQPWKMTAGAQTARDAVNSVDTQDTLGPVPFRPPSGPAARLMTFVFFRKNSKVEVRRPPRLRHDPPHHE